MKKVFNEELWEKYVQNYPEEFIGSGFKFLGKQIKLKRGRLDLLFIDKNEELVVVELQLKALDRSHFFRSVSFDLGFPIFFLVISALSVIRRAGWAHPNSKSNTVFGKSSKRRSATQR